VIFTGKKSQVKGRRGEIELCGILQESGIPAKPGAALNYGKEPDIKGVVGIHIECKRAEKLRLSEWLQQAERDAQRFGDGAPAVFHRKSRSPWLVTMKLSDWVTIYQKGEQKRENHI